MASVDNRGLTQGRTVSPTGAPCGAPYDAPCGAGHVAPTAPYGAMLYCTIPHHAHHTAPHGARRGAMGNLRKLPAAIDWAQVTSALLIIKLLANSLRL